MSLKLVQIFNFSKLSKKKSAVYVNHVQNENYWYNIFKCNDERAVCYRDLGAEETVTVGVPPVPDLKSLFLGLNNIGLLQNKIMKYDSF